MTSKQEKLLTKINSIQKRFERLINTEKSFYKLMDLQNDIKKTHKQITKMHVTEEEKLTLRKELEDMLLQIYSKTTKHI